MEQYCLLGTHSTETIVIGVMTRLFAYPYHTCINESHQLGVISRTAERGVRSHLRKLSLLDGAQPTPRQRGQVKISGRVVVNSLMLK